MILQKFVFQDLSINSYLIIDEKNKECIAIDPPRIIEPLKKYIEENRLKLKAIFETHVHADFASGALELKHAFKEVPKIYCSAIEPQWIPKYADEKVTQGTRFYLGSIIMEALHTPGHTPEHLTWLCYNDNEQIPFCAFTGDFLLVESVGRPDLLGAQYQEDLLSKLHESIFNKLKNLPDNLLIYPAHGAGSLCGKAIGVRPYSILGDERKTNQAFKESPNWKHGILKDLPTPPPTFKRNKVLNLKGFDLMENLPQDIVLEELDQLEATIKRSLVIDFRDPHQFAKGHLQKAINVPLSPSVGIWLAAIPLSDRPLLCILPDWTDKNRISQLIRTLGYDQPLMFTVFEKLKNHNLVALPEISVEALHEMQGKQEPVIIDVRTPHEWNQGHIEGALLIQLTELADQLSKIPKDRPVITVCGSGWRSSIAASFLQKEGYHDVHSLSGGMKAWQSVAQKH